MNALIEFYQNEAQQRYAHLDWLSAHQDRALHDLRVMGFPTKKMEDWRYTTLDLFYQTQFATASPSETAPAVLPDFPYRDAVMLAQGAVHIPDSLLQRCPQGIVIKPLSVMLQEEPERIRPMFDHVLRREHAFHALNTAMLSDGVVIIIPQGIHLEFPIVLRHWQNQAESASYYRHLVVVEPGASASIIEEYSGEQAVVCHTNAVTEMKLGAQAQITHYKIQTEGCQTFHISHVGAVLAEGANFQSHVVSSGARIGRIDTSCYFEGAHAQCLLNGIYSARGTAHLENHAAIIHRVPMCESHLDYKGVADDKARAVFNSKVYVAPDAMQTKAHQYNKNLLLSKYAAVDTKPQFEIFADDVTCAHGATVGFLDNEALFYLQSRGIEQDAAHAWLEQAFMAENVERMPDEILRAWVRRRIQGEHDE